MKNGFYWIKWHFPNEAFERSNLYLTDWNYNSFDDIEIQTIDGYKIILKPEWIIERSEEIKNPFISRG